MKKVSPALNSFDATSKTKVLLALGKIDRRVPPRAAYYFFRKLKKMGIDITCKDYDNQGHRIGKDDLVFDLHLTMLNLYLQE